MEIGSSVTTVNTPVVRSGLGYRTRTFHPSTNSAVRLPPLARPKLPSCVCVYEYVLASKLVGTRDGKTRIDNSPSFTIYSAVTLIRRLIRNDEGYTVRHVLSLRVNILRNRKCTIICTRFSPAVRSQTSVGPMTIFVRGGSTDT